jgi:AcrR family transcriptional regulator
MIVNVHARDVRTDLSYDSGALVTEDERRSRRPVAAGRMKIAVTNAGCLHLDEHLAWPRCAEFHGLDRKRRALLPQDRGSCLHHTRINTAENDKLPTGRLLIKVKVKVNDHGQKRSGPRSNVMSVRREPAAGPSERQSEIWRTAAQMIRDRGFGATSVNDIARAIGITKAGLYHHITSKETLLAEVLRFGLDQLEAEVVRPACAIKDPEERLRQLVVRHAEIVTRADGAVTQLVDEVPHLPSAARRQITRRMRKYFDLLRDTLTELKAAGRLGDIDPTVAAFSILGMINWLPRWFRRGRRLTASQVAHEIADMALAGLIRPARERPLRLVRPPRRQS